MKKLLTSIIILIMFALLIGINSYAQNGPIQGKSDIWFEEYENYNNIKRVYVDNSVYNEMSGATYDKNSNTLVLNNVKTEMALKTYAMGDNFKIKVIGNNEIGYLDFCIGEMRRKHKLYRQWSFNSKFS